MKTSVGVVLEVAACVCVRRSGGERRTQREQDEEVIEVGGC